MESEDNSTGTNSTNSNEANTCSTSNSTREDSTSTSSSELDTETQVPSNVSKRKVLLSDDSDQETKENARKTEITPSKSPALNKINALESSTSDDEDTTPVSKFKSQTSRIRQLSSSSSEDNDDNKVSPLKKTKLTNKESNELPMIGINMTQTKFISPLTTTTNSSSSSSTSDIESNIPTTSVRPPSERNSKVKERFKTIVKLLQTKNSGQKSSKEGTSNPDKEDHNPKACGSKNVTSSEACSSIADGGNTTREDKEKSGSSSSSKSNTSDDDDPSSINNIKKMIKKKHHAVKSTIYDPDTSDDEADNTNASQSCKRKQTKATSPKPIRMSAKEAMDNMQKIKSESNRMLREKEVSLPYHRPKALTLKDIMSRRKPALTADGKALPLKMNNEQLKQYAMLLEQRQKEMMELCKSDTDDEENDGDNENDQNKTDQTDNNNDQDSINIQNDKGVDIVENINKIDKVVVATDTVVNTEIQDSDKTFDEMMLTNSNIGNNEKTVEQLKSNNANNEEKDMSVDINNETVVMEVDDATNENKSKNETNVDEIDKDDAVTSIDKENMTTAAVLTKKTTAKDNNDSPILNNKVSFSNAEQNNTEKDSQLISLHFDSEKSNTDDVAKESIEGIVEVNNDALINELNSNIVQQNNTEKDSQLISLYFDSERTNTECLQENTEMESNSKQDDNRFSLKNDGIQDKSGFSDDDGFDDTDIDNLIENADIIREKISIDSPMLIREIQANSKPKITGQPGMVIDLDGTDPTQPRKCTGVELLKERFMYFSNMKTPEELERDRENKIKPGLQHLKLKQDLEDQISEQRSLEWTKRLEEEKQQKQELNAIIGDDDDEDELDKIEEKLENGDNDEKNEEVDDNGEEDDETVKEPPENDIDMTDKPKKRNLMLDDEAEESECDDELHDDETQNDDDDDADSESSDSSDSEPEIEGRKKGRIIKAFEDSDDENEKNDVNQTSVVTTESNASDDEDVVKSTSNLDLNKSNQDEELQSGQINILSSEDLFASQDTPNNIQAKSSINSDNVIIKNVTDSQAKVRNDSICLDNNSESILGNKDKIDVICETQPLENSNLDDVAAMCSGNFTQDPPLKTQSQDEIGDDILELCTGKFYNNKFLTQNTPLQDHIEQDSESILKDQDCVASIIEENSVATDKNKDDGKIKESNKNIEAENTILKSILDELDGPDFGAPKQKYFDSEVKNKENSQNVANSLGKKRFIIDSDDEDQNVTEENGMKKKKRKFADRALQISDDEEDSEEAIDEESDIDDDDVDEQTERVVEYDSEENEVVVLPQPKKKKRRIGDFFEQEAELTSEDEWVGSGDEDEAGLDVMEREEGDKDQFHQGLLRRELEQIHMREVMDQDKREVRLLQELLFEDGDLGSGHRQRKFRWRNADGDEMTGTNPDQLTDTPDEEFESEEMWRKERHEREVFLRSLTQTQDDSSPNVTLSRTAIIKANLTRSNTMSALLREETTVIEAESTILQKKPSKDVPSPVKNGFTIQQYRGSILSRGRSTLERLAALATPIAGDGEGTKLGSLPPSSKRNFVFATVSPVQDKNKVTKRKVEETPDTPRLLKKMKTEVKQNGSRSSLLEHFKV